MPSTAAKVRFNASRMREHLLGDTSESGRSESSHSPSLEATLPPPHLVRDPCYGVCLVWRPVEEPPLPRCIHTASQALEGDAEATGYRDEPLACAAARRDATTSTAATALQLRSPPVKAQSPRKTIRARESPPRGQLLRRGKGGIDDVLRNAREAQRLFYTLQEHRLQAEYRRSQGSLRQELDQQRQYKCMVQLAEYQAELVNIFGHTMQDAVADSFFDDGRFGAPLDVGYKGVAKASMQPSGTFCASRGDPLTGIMLVSAITDMMEVRSKTAVNTRASLASRLPKMHEEAPATSASLHRKIETTYDAAYAARPASRLTNAHSAHAATECAVAADGAALASGEQTYILHHHPTSAWESASHAAARNLQAERPLDFYASARKIEREDDDRRGGLVGRMQRSLDIRTKRAEDARLRPPSPTYHPIEPRSMPAAMAQEKFGVKSNYLDIVECTQLRPETEEQIAYDTAPLTRLPGETLSQELKVQSKVITQMGTSNELFRGTPKHLADTSVSYMGHVPVAQHNVSCIHHGDDTRRLFAKSTMTMSEHGGGIDIAVIGSNLVTRHRGGKNARAPRALEPKTTDAINQTVEGRMLQQTLYGTLERERRMNIRDDMQGHRYF
ncbi:hypothetical protein CGC21_38560 [Leishmania donovani]|nr:hypothetical protein CGC21_38560 [Leishmania donovani]